MSPEREAQLRSAQVDLLPLLPLLERLAAGEGRIAGEATDARRVLWHLAREIDFAIEDAGLAPAGVRPKACRQGRLQ